MATNSNSNFWRPNDQIRKSRTALGELSQNRQSNQIILSQSTQHKKQSQVSGLNTF